MNKKYIIINIKYIWVWLINKIHYTTYHMVIITVTHWSVSETLLSRNETPWSLIGTYLSPIRTKRMVLSTIDLWTGSGWCGIHLWTIYPCIIIEIIRYIKLLKNINNLVNLHASLRSPQTPSVCSSHTLPLFIWPLYIYSPAQVDVIKDRFCVVDL